MKKKTKYKPDVEKRGQLLLEKWSRYHGEDFYRADIPKLGIFSGKSPRELKEKIMDGLIERGR